MESEEKEIGSIREYLQESRNTFEELRWIWRDMVDDKSRQSLKSYLFFVLLTTMLSLSAPMAIQHLIDGLAKSDASVVVFGLMAYAAITVATKLAQYFQTRSQELSWCAVYESIEYSTNELFFQKSPGQHAREGKAFSVSNVQTGREKIQWIFEMLLWQGSTQVVRFVLAIFFLLILSPICVLILSLGICIQIVWSLYSNWISVKNFNPIISEYRKIGRYKGERWKHMERVKVNGMSDEEVRTLADWMRENVNKDRDFSISQIKHYSARDLTLFATSLAAVAYTAYKVTSGDWSVGMFFPIMMWMGLATDQLNGIMQIERQITRQLPSIKAMHQALALPPEVVDSPNAIHLNGEPISLEIRELSHRYRPETLEKDSASDDTHLPVLENINLKMLPGERVGLIGQSGIGKTTLGRLILRYEDPESGAILVNGINLKEIRGNDWHRVTGLIAQREQVFDGTIRDNLVYGLKREDREKMTDEELWSIARKLKVDFGERLTKGLDTVVGMSGIKLSGGQAQRLLIASAVIRKPRLIIIDEATSSLDSSTEQEVQRGIVELLPKETSALIIAHRLSTLQALCNRFVVMSDATDKSGAHRVGRIETVADSFEDLWTCSPTFQKLAQDQGLLAP